MNYENVFAELGFKYLGPCACKKKTGYMFASPTEAAVELWIFPREHKIKKKVWGETTLMRGYTDETLAETINGLNAPA